MRQPEARLVEGIGQLVVPSVMQAGFGSGP